MEDLVKHPLIGLQEICKPKVRMSIYVPALKSEKATKTWPGKKTGKHKKYYLIFLTFYYIKRGHCESSNASARH